MKLYLLRHGTAVDATQVGGDDAARILTEQGRERVVQAARAMRRLGMRPDAIVSSPLPRALETAELTAQAIGFRGHVQREDGLKPGATPGQMLRLAARQGGGEAIMLVGHNPDLEQLVAWLTASGTDAEVELRKGSLAVVHVEHGQRDLGHPGGGRLVGLYPGKHLARLGR